MTDPSGLGRIRVSRLICHAVHPDPDRRGERCGSLLTYARGEFVFVATADNGPETLDEVARTALQQEHADTWVRCDEPGCGRWNRFRIVPS